VKGVLSHLCILNFHIRTSNIRTFCSLFVVILAMVVVAVFTQATLENLM